MKLTRIIMVLKK